MSTSANGRPEVPPVPKDHPFIPSNLIGPCNETTITVNNTTVCALIDSGSMISTISHSCLPSLKFQPDVHSIQSLGLQVNIANGSTLDYEGVVECEVTIPYLNNFTSHIPLLVVPDTHLNRSCPIIIGTNVIRLCRDYLKENPASCIPDTWDIAFDSIKCNSFVVKSSNKHSIMVEPYQTVTVKGISRNVPSTITEAITENMDSNKKFMVCPQVTKLDNQGSCTNVQVKLCNMSAKCISIKPKSNLCTISGVSVVDNLAGDDSDVSTCKQVPCNPVEKLGVKVDTESLDPDQLDSLNELLLKWEDVFSIGPTYLGKTDLIRHKIVLEDDKPFKQPYRKIPPSMYE